MLEASSFRLVGQQSESLAFPNHGHDVRIARGGKDYPQPTSHFLLYIQENGSIDPRRMWDPFITDIDASEVILFNKARGPAPTALYLGRGFTGMLWRHPCFITIVLDNDGYEFNFDRDPANPDGAPITFIDTMWGRRYDPNFSFYNATPVRLPVLDQDGNDTGVKRSGIRFTNHVKADAAGNGLGINDTRVYKMNLNIWKQNADGTTTFTSTDPDGQNQGPPTVP